MLNTVLSSRVSKVGRVSRVSRVRRDSRVDRVSRVSKVRVRVSVRFSGRYKNLGPPFIGLPKDVTQFYSIPGLSVNFTTGSHCYPELISSTK